MGLELLTLNKEFVSKLFKRSVIIFLSGLNSIIILIGNLVISYYVISFTSATLWGGFVSIIIILDFAFVIITWGNVPYLIREFSLQPQRGNGLWQTSFKSRIPILIAFLGIIFCLEYPLTIKALLFCWSLARFFYQSFDPIVLFNRNFKFSLVIELIGLILILIPTIIFRENLNLNLLISLYAFSICFKSIVSIIKYRAWFDGFFKNLFDYSFKYFATAFPFLIMSLSGMLQAKADLYSVAYFLSDKEVARYQLFIGSLGFAQFVAQLFLIPFEKSIFRLNKRSLERLSIIYLFTGILASSGLELLAYFLFEYVYEFHFSFKMYLIGYLYILIFYFYLLKTYELRKANKQSNIAIFSLMGGLINLLCGIFLIPQYQIEGALFSGVIGQLFLTLTLYLPFNKKISRPNY